MFNLGISQSLRNSFDLHRVVSLSKDRNVRLTALPARLAGLQGARPAPELPDRDDRNWLFPDISVPRQLGPLSASKETFGRLMSALYLEADQFEARELGSLLTQSYRQLPRKAAE